MYYVDGVYENVDVDNLLCFEKVCYNNKIKVGLSN